MALNLFREHGTSLRLRGKVARSLRQTFSTAFHIFSADNDAEQSAAYAHGGTERFGRKGIISLIAAGLALVLCLCIVLPVVLLHRNPSTPGLIGGGTLDSIDTADEF